MKRPSAEGLSRGAFLVSVVVIAMVYGIFSSWRGWFPAPQVGLAHRTMIDLSSNWRNDLALEPTRHLVAPDDSGETPDPDRGYARGPAGEPEPGYVLVAGLSEDQDTSAHVVRMFDTEGEEVHRWPIHYDRLDQKARPQNVMLHGMEVFEDGSLAVTFDSGNAIARVDACGEPLWVANDNYHHTITRDGIGGLMTWRSEDIVRLDEETGEETFALSLRDTIVHAADGEQQAVLDIRTRSPEGPDQKMRYVEDPFHPNDAEALLPEMADAFPMFEAGDIMMSLRELNLVAVVDPETGVLKWYRHGPWIKQHDPDFQPDGTITIYDNATGTGASKIRRIDPADDSQSIIFDGRGDQPFYSWRRGKHQILPGGNILLTEAEHGRVLEVTPDGEVVWTRDMVWDADSNLIITEARHVGPDFFDGGLPSCLEQTASR